MRTNTGCGELQDHKARESGAELKLCGRARQHTQVQLSWRRPPMSDLAGPTVWDDPAIQAARCRGTWMLAVEKRSPANVSASRSNGRHSKLDLAASSEERSRGYRKPLSRVDPTCRRRHSSSAASVSRRWRMLELPKPLTRVSIFVRSSTSSASRFQENADRHRAERP